MYATLVKLQEEVSQITEITEILKDADNIKDSKTFVEEIKKEFGVSYTELGRLLCLINSMSIRIIKGIFICSIHSTSQNGQRKLTVWANISMNAVNTCNRYHTCTSVRWLCSQPTKTT